MRCAGFLPLLAVPALLISACSDEEASGPCGAIEDAVLEEVVYVDPDAPAYDAEGIEQANERSATIRELAEDPPPAIADDVADLAVLHEVRAEEGTDEELLAGFAAYERLAAWAVGSCDVDDPVWRCMERATFNEVEELGPADIGEGEPVEVDGGERPLEAWLDDDGLVVRAETTDEGPRMRSSCHE